MDLSKLPKLSQSPEPPPSSTDPAPPAAKRVVPRLSIADLGLDILVFVALGAIFMMLGPSFGGWLIAKIRGVPYETGVVWSPGTPKENQPVELFELSGGTGWLYMGLWTLGACLVVSALLMLLMLVLPRLTKSLLLFTILFCVGGAIANVVAIIMQVQAGYTQPILSVVGVLAGGMCAFFPGRHLMDMRQGG